MMAIICPTVTPLNPHQFREQIERIAPFVTEVHLDFADKSFTDIETPDLSQTWWPHTLRADLHLMYKQPQIQIETAISLNPKLVIVHAEAEFDYSEVANKLHQAGIQFGVALLPETAVSVVAEHIDVIDHVLIFSGHLGHFGGEADLNLLSKVKEVKQLKSELTIGWDGGINDQNIAELVAGGVDVLNVGGFIQRADDPRAAYQQLEKLLQ